MMYTNFCFRRDLCNGSGKHPTGSTPEPSRLAKGEIWSLWDVREDDSSMYRGTVWVVSDRRVWPNAPTPNGPSQEGVHGEYPICWRSRVTTDRTSPGVHPTCGGSRTTKIVCQDRYEEGMKVGTDPGVTGGLFQVQVTRWVVGDEGRGRKW